jgi:hypothetical protein
VTDARWRNWPLDLPGGTSTPILQQASTFVAQHLAEEGLLATTAKTLVMLSPIVGTLDDERVLSLLQTIGLPIDLLDYYRIAPGVAPHVSGTLGDIRRLLGRGQNLAHVLDQIGKASFEFRRTNPQFSALPEGSDKPIGMVHLQLSSANYWRGEGDGCGIDIAGQLLRSLPEAQFLIGIDERNVPQLLSHLRNWQSTRRGPITITAIPEGAKQTVLDQWAQDVGKPGVLTGETKSAASWATLLPRYVSRGEESTVFDPASAFVGELMLKAGHSIVESPLIFQGGNVLIARHPSTGKRTLLVGEAEICRNTALGLTSAQAIEALRVEMNADAAVVLPAVSFHLDFEVSLREHRGRLLAFVNDATPASRQIARLGADALTRAGVLTADAARKAGLRLDAGHDDEFVNEVAPAIMKLAGPQGAFSSSSSRWFSAEKVDSGSANLQRFLLAIDTLACRGGADQRLPTEPFARAYIVAMRQRDKDRAALHARLAAIGCEVIAVPSTADEDRSVNYINALHEPGRVFMPAYGGFLLPMDKAAADAFSRSLGPEISIVPILSGESQRRLGAVHCSAAIYHRM